MYLRRVIRKIPDLAVRLPTPERGPRGLPKTRPLHCPGGGGGKSRGVWKDPTNKHSRLGPTKVLLQRPEPSDPWILFRIVLLKPETKHLSHK